MAEQLAYQSAAGPDVSSVVKIDDDDDDDDEDYQEVDNTTSANSVEEASIIDEYFGLHDITPTSGSGCDVAVPEMPRAYDSSWPLNQTPASTPPSSMTAQTRLFTSVSDNNICNRKYYDFAQPQTDFVDLGGAYVTTTTSGTEIRPPPCYPMKRDEKVGASENLLARQPETGNTFQKLYTESYSDAYGAQYGSGAAAIPVIIEPGQYGGGIATGGVLNDGRYQQYYLSAGGSSASGNGSSCAAGYLSVDVGGFGPSMFRSLGFQSSTAAWPTALRQ